MPILCMIKGQCKNQNEFGVIKLETFTTSALFLLQQDHPADERVEEKDWEDGECLALFLDNVAHEHHGRTRTPHEANSNDGQLKEEILPNERHD